MELRFGVNPLRSQPISKDQSTKPSKSRSKKLGKDQDAKLGKGKDTRLEVVARNSQKTKDFQKIPKNDPGGGKSLHKEVEKLGSRFSFRLPVIRANVSSEGSSRALSYDPTGRSTRPLSATETIETTPEFTMRSTPSTEALHIGESSERCLEEEVESEKKTPKTDGTWSSNKVPIPANMLIDNSQKQDEVIKWKANIMQKKLPKEEERNFRSQLSELRPKISALTRSLNSLQVNI